MLETASADNFSGDFAAEEKRKRAAAGRCSEVKRTLHAVLVTVVK